MGPGSVAPPRDHEDHDRDDEQPAHSRDPEGARSAPRPTLGWRPMSIPGIPGRSSVRTARTTAAIRIAATAMPMATSQPTRPDPLAPTAGAGSSLVRSRSADTPSILRHVVVSSATGSVPARMGGTRDEVRRRCGAHGGVRRRYRPAALAARGEAPARPAGVVAGSAVDRPRDRGLADVSQLGGPRLPHLGAGSGRPAGRRRGVRRVLWHPGPAAGRHRRLGPRGHSERRGGSGAPCRAGCLASHDTSRRVELPPVRLRGDCGVVLRGR